MEYNVIDTEIDRTFILMDDLVSHNVMALEDEINNFIKNDDRDVIIDLSYVRKIDSMSIAAIIRIKNRLTEESKSLHLTNPGESVMKVLELAGLDTFLLE